MEQNYDRFGMVESELTYFTHCVDGQRYGAWYRVTSADHLEVIGVGMLETTEFAGFSPESTARSVLENCVREQRSLGIAMPCLDTGTEPNDDGSTERAGSTSRRESRDPLHR